MVLHVKTSISKIIFHYTSRLLHSALKTSVANQIGNKIGGVCGDTIPHRVSRNLF